MNTPTLDEMMDELRRGRVYEVALADPQWHLDGIQVGEAVYVDPRPAVLETLVHELLHRRFPRLGERSVDRIARRLVGSMDDRTKAAWWRAYLRIRRKGRPLQVE